MDLTHFGCAHGGRLHHHSHLHGDGTDQNGQGFQNCMYLQKDYNKALFFPSIHTPPPPPRLSLASILWSNEWWLFFLFPPTSHDLQYISKTSGFTRLSMKIKCVCGGLINLYISFHNNRTMWSTNLHVTYKNLQVVVGGGGVRKKSLSGCSFPVSPLSK